MKISGKELAATVLDDIASRVRLLKEEGVHPAFAVIQVGDNNSSTSYIQQKKKTAHRVGIKMSHLSFSRWISYQKIAEAIHRLNNNPGIHGVVIQQPLPPALSTGSFNKSVELSKDVDGFKLKSPFRQPVSRAVMHILYQIFDKEHALRLLKSKRIVIVGRGMTGGKPVADELQKRKIPHIIIHSKTTNKKEFYESADILITCIGKKHVVPASYLKDGVILLGIGISSHDGKSYGDFNEARVRQKAAYYTPTPGGIGPLTVAFLLDNVVTAAEKTVKGEED